MSGYNKINGDYASGNHHLLNEVLRGAWGYKGHVMSDWGAVPEWEYALKGLDQEIGLAAGSPLVQPRTMVLTPPGDLHGRWIDRGYLNNGRRPAQPRAA
jgi:Glycosyl hydrolase family 3 N terminal domain